MTPGAGGTHDRTEEEASPTIDRAQSRHLRPGTPPNALLRGHDLPSSALGIIGVCKRAAAQTGHHILTPTDHGHLTTNNKQPMTNPYPPTSNTNPFRYSPSG